MTLSAACRTPPRPTRYRTGKKEKFFKKRVIDLEFSTVGGL
jgi:hypothetical protein